MRLERSRNALLSTLKQTSVHRVNRVSWGGGEGKKYIRRSNDSRRVEKPKSSRETKGETRRDEAKVQKRRGEEEGEEKGRVRTRGGRLSIRLPFGVSLISSFPSVNISSRTEETHCRYSASI